MSKTDPEDRHSCLSQTPEEDRHSCLSRASAGADKNVCPPEYERKADKNVCPPEDARAADAPGDGFQPKIVAYVCNWCTYLGADLAGTNRLEYPANVRIIRLPCTGRIDFNLLVKAFEIGADAVLVSGCHPGDCHYTSGNYHARRRWILFRELLDTLGIDTARVHFSWISAAEGKKFQQVITEITDQTRRLGPYRAYREICGTEV